MLAPATLVLKPGRERSLLRRHPWIFTGAVAELCGQAALGDTVIVCSNAREPLGRASYNPRSKIAARMWSFSPDEAIDRAWFVGRLAAAVRRREIFLSDRQRLVCRLVHAESDGLPGLVVDRYGDQLVLAATSAGAARHREALTSALCEVTGLANVYERSDADVMVLEGLSASTGALSGQPPAEALVIEEGEARLCVDVRAGHKTGFYLDQRNNRAFVHSLARGRDVLDAFCYSGGFAIAAALGGARSVVAVDSSPEALALARRNAQLSGLPDAAVAFERADVFAWLRTARDSGRTFDLVVLDPPKFAPTMKLAERAARGYKDINLLAFKLLRPGGVLLTFSCSSGVSSDLFQKIVAGAATDARVDARFVSKLGAGADHPVALAFPEGEYLKGLLCAL